MSASDRIELHRSVDQIPVAAWRELAAASRADTVFASWEWLKAWSETLGEGSDVLIPMAYRGDTLVGAVALENRAGVIGFAARERRDYCDALISGQLDTEESLEVLGSLLTAAGEAVESFQCFELSRVPESSPLLGALEGETGFHAIKRGTTPAPRMDMVTVDEKLKKKSLRRHANALARMGTLTFNTYDCASDIDPLLDAFFDQHMRRWQGTESPSLFIDSANRSFYRALTRHMNDSGALRFSTVHLDDRLVAAHYGFFHAGIFTWYKPSFEPELSKHSPGEVLIKYLLESARDEGARVFDFTIGDESFKLRFATEIQQVVDLRLTDSLISAWMQRGRSALGRLVRD